MTARAAQAIVNSFAWTDANPVLNLSSFVTTDAEPETVEVARTHMYKNYVDHDMYPQVYVMERLMVNWLHDLWNGPKGVEPYGAATIGSSEACMLAGLAHKWNWRKARQKQGRIQTDHGHTEGFCWEALSNQCIGWCCVDRLNRHA
jgi:glutamate decarboxylase